MTLIHGGTGLSDTGRWINTQDKLCADWKPGGNRFRWTLDALAETAAPLL